MSSTFIYTSGDFIFETNWNENENSTFDNVLKNKWMFIHDHENLFKYKLKIDHSKILPGKYEFLAQLNTDRALLRRKPAEMQSINQEFNPNAFNFTKMDKREILFAIINKDSKELGNYLAINVSPLEFGHCLLLPSLYSCLPQVLTPASLMSAVQLFLLSKSPSLRMGFNGLCAYASVNHLHFHLYYLDHRMLLETIEVEHLAGPCYVLSCFPSRGFVFQLARGQDLSEFVRNIYKLVHYLQEREKPHNLFITRGSSFEEKTASLVRDCVRLYVWARKPVYGAKQTLNEDYTESMSPALCELFGHLLIKTGEFYDMVTEDTVTEILSDITVEPFNCVVDDVKHMFL